MGITICCKKTKENADLTYLGFSRFRQLVAERCGDRWARHYEKLLLPRAERRESDGELDEITARMIEKKAVPIKIVDFLLQPEVGGSIRYGACGTILRRLEGYGENPLYGYAAWGPDAAHLSDVKKVMEACVASKSDLTWSG